MRRRPNTILIWGLVFVAGCGSGDLGSLSPSTPSSTSLVTQSTDQATSTTSKPAVTVESLTATTVTSAGNDGGDPTTTTTEAPTSTTSEPSGTVQVPQSILAAVIEDAAKVQNVDVDVVTVSSGQPVDWSDASLGCPDPNKSYIQVITPGYLVLLEAGGVTLEYHLNQQGGFKQCTGGTFSPPSGY